MNRTTNLRNHSEDEWGFYIDIEKPYSHNSLNHYVQKKIPDVITEDASYCIDIHDFGQETNNKNNYYHNATYNATYNDTYNATYNDTYNATYDCNLYNTFCYTLEYYRNKFNTKKVTNMIIKVSSTTFATIALSYVILAIL